MSGYRGPSNAGVLNVKLTVIVIDGWSLLIKLANPGPSTVSPSQHWELAPITLFFFFLQYITTSKYKNTDQCTPRKKKSKEKNKLFTSQ